MEWDALGDSVRCPHKNDKYNVNDNFHDDSDNYDAFHDDDFHDHNEDDNDDDNNDDPAGRRLALRK